MEFEKVTYPQRSCRDAVWGDYMAHSCEMPDLHDGPCVSLSVRASIQRREAWEAERKNTAGEDPT